MLQVTCKGTPYEIGYQHGTAAREKIAGSIAFYGKLFQYNSKLEWPQVRDAAREFAENIEKKWPKYYEEMKGVADGSQHDILDIVALNVRTEIAYGMFSDGCTSLTWKTLKRSFQGQNWDWQAAQKPNLLILTITQPPLPTIKMVTEAGIIGKIGLNSAGVGVCLNAIKAVGLSPTHLPAHLGLRLALESRSAASAVSALEAAGMASSAYILVGDADQSIGFEFTATTTAQLAPDERGRVFHTNHLLAPHPGVKELHYLDDSPVRIARLRELVAAYDEAGREPGWEEFAGLFDDHAGAPGAICRYVKEQGVGIGATLFNIVMDLRERKAVVRVGRPCKVEETVVLEFEEEVV